jgi:hypothetical protein
MPVEQLGQRLAADAKHSGGGSDRQARRFDAQLPDHFAGMRGVFHRHGFHLPSSGAGEREPARGFFLGGKEIQGARDLAQ